MFLTYFSACTGFPQRLEIEDIFSLPVTWNDPAIFSKKWPTFSSPSPSPYYSHSKTKNKNPALFLFILASLATLSSFHTLFLWILSIWWYAIFIIPLNFHSLYLSVLILNLSKVPCACCPSFFFSFMLVSEAVLHFFSSQLERWAIVFSVLYFWEVSNVPTFPNISEKFVPWDPTYYYFKVVAGMCIFVLAFHFYFFNQLFPTG